MLRLTSKIKFITNNALRTKIASIFFVPSQAWPLMNIRYLNFSQYASSSFNFSTEKQRTQLFQKQHLSDVLEEYKMKADKLRIAQHFQYFQRVFKTKEQINQNSMAWKILNSNIHSHLKRYKYHQVCAILNNLSQSNIQNNLAKEAQEIVFNDINKNKNLKLTQYLLRFLNKQKVELNAQVEQKYFKLYDSMLQLIPIRKKNQSSKVKQIQESPLIVIYDSRNEPQKQEGQIKIQSWVFLNLLVQLKSAKVKNFEIFRQLIRNAFLSQNGKQNFQKFTLHNLKRIFQLTFNIYSNQNPSKNILLKVFMEQILNRQNKHVNEKQNYLQYSFIYSLLHYLTNLEKNPKLLSNLDWKNSQEPKQFHNQLRKYFKLILIQLQKQKNQLQNLNFALRVFFEAKCINLSQQKQFKSLLDFAVQKIQQINDGTLAQIIFILYKDGLKQISYIKEHENKIWAQIWKRYPNFNNYKKKVFQKMIFWIDSKLQIKIQVPENITVLDGYAQENTKSDQNKTRKPKNNQKTKFQKMQQDIFQSIKYINYKPKYSKE